MSLNRKNEGEIDIPGFIDDLVGMHPSGENPHEIDTSFRRKIIRSMSERGLVPDDDLLFGLESDTPSPDENALVGSAFSQEELDVYDAYLDEEFFMGIGGRGDILGEEDRLDATCLQHVAHNLGYTKKEIYDMVIKVKTALGYCPAKE